MAINRLPGWLKRALLAGVAFSPAVCWAAKDASDGDGSMSAVPAQVVAGSAGNSFTFSWRNSSRGKFNTGSQCSILFPAGWTAPQNSNSNAPGFLGITTVGNASASIASITGSGSWTVTLNITANQSDSHGFDLTYAGSGVRAPSALGGYTFVTKTRQVGGTLTDIAVPPQIQVTGSGADQTISFPHIPDQAMTSRVVLAATASSGLPVSFLIRQGPALLADGTNLTFSGTGWVSVVASQAGDQTWNPAPEATNSFLVVEEGGGSGGGVGMENFNNFSYTGGVYAGGTFLGQDGSTWAYSKARGDLSINGRSPTLDKARGSFIRSGIVAGGVGRLSLKYRKADKFALNCIVHVNGARVGVISEGDGGDVLTWTSGVLNVQGSVVLLFTNSASSGPITLDDIAWTPYAAGPQLAVVTLHDLAQVYNGTPRAASATTEPPGLGVSLVYDGLAEPPTDAGRYTVLANVTEPGYEGHATGTLVIAKADQAIEFPAISHKLTTDQVALSATASSGLDVAFDVVSGAGVIGGGTNLAFIGAGVVVVRASQAGDANWNTAASVTQSFEVSKAAAGVTLNNLNQIYDGTPRTVTATTTPDGLAVDISYDGSSQAPTEPGIYAVTGAVNNAMYEGVQAGALTVDKANAVVELHALAQTYDGSAHPVSVTTVPEGLAVLITYDGLSNPPVNAGNYSVTAVVSDARYVGSVAGLLAVSKAGQAITFPNPGPQQSTNRVGLSASAGSGLGVSFAVVSGPGLLADGTNLTFTGGGVVQVTASQNGDANWNPAPEVTQAVAIMGLYTLAVSSDHGSVTPSPGLYTFTEGARITNSVQTPSLAGTTQFNCLGWALTGHSPETGSGAQFVLTLTNNAVLTWRWGTNYWLAAGAEAHGSVNIASGWWAAGASVQITAAADPYYHFEGWTGDVSGSANPLSVPMDGAKSVSARFAENRAAHGTPEWWLARHYPSTTNFDQAAMSDTDGDGYPAWQEWIAGTDPTNQCCCLDLSPEKTDRLSILTRTGRVYTVCYKTSLMATNWSVQADGIPGTGAAINFTNVVAGRYYRIKVRLP